MDFFLREVAFLEVPRVGQGPGCGGGDDYGAGGKRGCRGADTGEGGAELLLSGHGCGAGDDEISHPREGRVGR